jgi:integrase
MRERRINDLKPQTPPQFRRIPVLRNLKSAKPKRRGAGGAIAFLSQAEIERLLGVITSPRDRAIFSIAYHRGLRASEVGMLEMRDYTPPTINARVGTLYCRRLKDSLSKIYDLTKGEEKELRAWFRLRGKQPGPLFPSRHNRPIGRSTLLKLMLKYGTAAGIKRNLCHFHTLKHTCAVSLLQQGMGVDQVQSWLGHRSIQSTMIYLRVVDIRLKDAAEKLVNWR